MCKKPWTISTPSRLCVLASVHTKAIVNGIFVNKLQVDKFVSRHK